MTDTTPQDKPASGHAEAAQHGAPELEQHDYSKYLLYSRTEILFLLRALIQRGCMINVQFDGSQHFFLTALLAISSDSNWIYFDPGSDETINQKALKADKLVFSTVLDKVKIQFRVGGLQITESGSRRVFAAKLPDTVLRLQRREYYRLSTSLVTPLKCSFDLPRVGEHPVPLDATVLDISGGGLGLQIANDFASHLDTGAVFRDCRINLPEEGLLSTSLCVRNVFNVETKTGHHYLRVGCEYLDLPGTRLTMIQRYITRAERERKARAAGE